VSVESREGEQKQTGAGKSGQGARRVHMKGRKSGWGARSMGACRGLFWSLEEGGRGVRGKRTGVRHA
jgi:hypothetical protein